MPSRRGAELIVYAKANPGKLNAGSHGKANTSRGTGIDCTVVHYKGAQPAVAALISGEVSFMFDTGVVIPHAQAGGVRVIATTGPKRSSILPDAPTTIEAVFAEFEVVSWYAPRASLYRQVRLD